MKRVLLKLIPGVLGLMLFLPVQASACPVCFGAPDDPTTKSIGWGILFLLGVVVSVLGTVAGFFVYIVKRAAAVNEPLPVAEFSPAIGKA